MFGALWSTSDNNFFYGHAEWNKTRWMIGRIFDFYFQFWYNPQLVPLYACAEKPVNHNVCPPRALYMNLVATYVYIRCTYNTCIQYSYRRPFHTGRIDPLGMVKIVYIVCTCMLNNVTRETQDWHYCGASLSSRCDQHASRRKSIEMACVFLSSDEHEWWDGVIKHEQ